MSARQRSSFGKGGGSARISKHLSMNWSIRAKILGGYAVAVAVLVAFVVIAYRNVERLVDAADWEDHARQVLGHVTEGLLELNQAESGQRGYLLSDDEKYLVKIHGVGERVEAHMDALKRLVSDNPEQRERLSRLHPLIEAKLARLLATVEARSAADLERLKDAASLAKGRELTEQIAALGAEMSDAERELLEKRTRAADESVKLFYLELWIAVPVATLLLLLIGAGIARAIARPLGMVTRAAERIASGDPEVELPAADGTDEVGRLAASFRRMSAVLAEVSAVNTRIAQGDLTVETRPQSSGDKFGTAHREMIEKLSLLVGSVQRAGLQVNTSATEIAATSKQQQATANEIAATTTEIGATSREIAATSKELVRTVGEVNRVAEQTAGLAGDGQAGLARMETTMRGIMDASAGITGKLSVLNEKATNINAVVTTITKVADQTNLLSLNAAIEAEKAGEYGLGFAVVATEIRRLADQTAVATCDIEQMVKEMQSAVAAGVMGMDKFAEEVRRGVEEVRQVGAQLAGIIQQVQSLAPRFEAVNEGMQSQSTGAQQITEALAQLSEAAQQTAESLRSSSEAIEHLNESARELQGGVARFRLRA